MNARQRLSLLLLAAALTGAGAAGDPVDPAPPAAQAVASAAEPWRAVAAAGPVDSRSAEVAPWTHVSRGDELAATSREDAEMELVREDSRERDGLKRETLRLAEAESRRLDAAVDRMDADLADATLSTDGGVLTLDSTTLLLEDERTLDRLATDDPAKLDDASADPLLDPIEQVIDDTLRKDTTSSTTSGTTSSGTSGS